MDPYHVFTDGFSARERTSNGHTVDIVHNVHYVGPWPVALGLWAFLFGSCAYIFGLSKEVGCTVVAQTLVV
jgi:hypothetical protein